MRSLLNIALLFALATIGQYTVPQHTGAPTTAGGGGGGPTLTCNAGGQAGGTGSSITQSASSGDTLIVYLTSGNPANFTSLLDSNSNALTSDNTGWISPDSDSERWFHEKLTSSVTGVTTAWSAASEWGLVVCDVSTLPSGSVDAIDNTGNFSFGSATWSTKSLTTSNADDLVCAGLYVDSGSTSSLPTANSPFTIEKAVAISGTLQVAMACNYVTSTGSYSAGGTNVNTDWISLIVGYK